MSFNYQKLVQDNKALTKVHKLNDLFNKDKQLCNEPLRDVIEKYFDNNWEEFFKGIKESFRLRTAEPDFDYSECFTLDYVIYAVRQELTEDVNKYIDEKQIVENWIIINKIPDEYKHYVWNIYNDYIDAEYR